MLCAVRQNGKVDTVAVSVSSCSEYRNEGEDYPSSLLEEAKEGEDEAGRNTHKRKKNETSVEGKIKVRPRKGNKV